MDWFRAVTCEMNVQMFFVLTQYIEHGIIGEGSPISTNQNREKTVFLLLIGLNLRPLPDNTVLYKGYSTVNLKVVGGKINVKLIFVAKCS